MAITTYSELQTAVGNWLNRGDLTSRIPEFIALAEADLRRRLRDKANVSSLTLGAGTPTFGLATNVKSVSSLRYNTGTYNFALREKSPQGLAALRRAGTGMPRAYAVVDGTLYFDVTPDSAYTLQATIIEKITPLSVSNTSNSTLTNSPDIYLYGSLIAAAPFLEHDERVQTWSQLYELAIAAENAYRESQEFGATPEMDLPVVFGEDC